MILELQEPYRSHWRKGYLQQHADGRRYVVLFNSNEYRSIVSYARYLMSVKLGYYVPDDLEVDHKDDDLTNDDINNLQLLTGEQNRLKQQYKAMMEQECYGYHCAGCNTPFVLTRREVNMKLAQGVEMAFCSRRCAAIYQHAVKKL